MGHARAKTDTHSGRSEIRSAKSEVRSPKSEMRKPTAVREAGFPSEFKLRTSHFGLPASNFPLRTSRRMNDNPDAIGIIAGNRSLPLLFATQARAMGVKRLVAVAFHGETDEA